MYMYYYITQEMKKKAIKEIITLNMMCQDNEAFVELKKLNEKYKQMLETIDEKRWIKK